MVGVAGRIEVKAQIEEKAFSIAVSSGEFRAIANALGFFENKHAVRHASQPSAARYSVQRIGVLHKMSRPNVQKILYKNVQLICLF